MVDCIEGSLLARIKDLENIEAGLGRLQGETVRAKMVLIDELIRKKEGEAKL